MTIDTINIAPDIAIHFSLDILSHTFTKTTAFLSY